MVKSTQAGMGPVATEKEDLKRLKRRPDDHAAKARNERRIREALEDNDMKKASELTQPSGIKDASNLPDCVLSP